MTLTYGFYDSVASDRLYNAKQMGSIFDGLILDGVYPNYGDALEVLEDTAMDVTVGVGRAWFNHTWSYNDALLGVTVPTADALLDRIDIVYLEIDESVGVRANDIDILEGTPASTPVPPTLQDTSTLHQYALAHIYVAAGVTSIIQADITDMVGTEFTPFVELVTLSEDMQAQIYAIVGDTNPPLIDLLEVKAHDHTTDTPQIPAAGLATDAVETAKIKSYNVTSIKLAPDSVIAGKIADGAVDDPDILAAEIIDETKIGTRAIVARERQGGDPVHWGVEGSTDYVIPGRVRIQCGATRWTGSLATSGNMEVTFPEDVWFGGTPIVLINHLGSIQVSHIIMFSTQPSSNKFSMYWEMESGASAITELDFQWIAIGPEFVTP